MLRSITHRCAVMAAILFTAGMGCSSEHAATMKVQAWARATPPGATVGGVYLIIDNPGARDRLLSVRTAASERAEIHQTSTVDGQMQMREIDGLEIPAGGEVKFEPGGLHLMLVGLKQALNEGEIVPLTLEFEHGAPLHVQARVEPLGALAPSESPSDHPAHN